MKRFAIVIMVILLSIGAASASPPWVDSPPWKGGYDHGRMPLLNWFCHTWSIFNCSGQMS